jgi:hypothetical protein
MIDTLFVLPPRFDDGGTTYFCPFCAQVIGFLTYFPEVRDTLQVVELGFPRPRMPIIELVGEAHQGMPLLVLGGTPTAVPGVTVEQANGRHFIKNTLAIIRYLAATRGVPLPH